MRFTSPVNGGALRKIKGRTDPHRRQLRIVVYRAVRVRLPEDHGELPRL